MGRVGLVVVVLAIVSYGCTAQAGPSQATTVSPSPVVSPLHEQGPSPLLSLEPSPPPAAPASLGPPLSADATRALDLATRYETARAAGNWSDAWELLSEQSRAAIGSPATFAANERAYDDAGGEVFTIQGPTRDPDLLANFLGADAAQIAQVADVGRGWLVFVGHPDVKAASAGTTGLFVAPMSSGQWQIWIVH